MRNSGNFRKFQGTTRPIEDDHCERVSFNTGHTLKEKEPLCACKRHLLALQSIACAKVLIDESSVCDCCWSYGADFLGYEFLEASRHVGPLLKRPL